MGSIEDLREKYDRATLTETPVTTDLIFFERKKPEIRKIFRKKIAAIKQEKEVLEEIVKAKNNEIEDLKKIISTHNETIKSPAVYVSKDSSALPNLKAVELEKKNRLLQTELDIAKKLNKSLENQLNSLKTEERVASHKDETESQKQLQEQVSSEDLQVKLNQTKQKLFDSLNQNIELKNQLKLARKCIQQEIGENVNLNILASSEPTWRGRAQQILSLELKVKELKEELQNLRMDGNISEDSLDDPSISKTHINHRVEIEFLQKDIATLSSHIQDLNQKIAALKARNSSLVAEVGKMKEKCSDMEQAASNSDATIANLREKMESQKYHYENRISSLQKQIEDTQKERENFKFFKEESTIKIENLQLELDNREQHIKDLNDSIKNLEKNLKLVCGDFLFECKDLKREEFVGLLNALESEKNNLLEINKTLNERLNDERNMCLSLAEQISKLKTKIFRVEGKHRDLEKNKNCQMENKKRSQRISQYTNSIKSNKSTISSLIFENSSLTGIPSSNCCCGQAFNFEIADLKNKLEIAEEKIALLENKLKFLSIEKQNDTKAFENLLRTSKSALLDTIQHLKSPGLE